MLNFGECSENAMLVEIVEGSDDCPLKNFLGDDSSPREFWDFVELQEYYEQVWM